MNLDFFKTLKTLPFLYYTSTPRMSSEGAVYDSISLEMTLMPVLPAPPVEVLSQLWEVENNHNIQQAYKHEHGRMFASNILRTSIARKSRRACGNIIIVPNENEKQWFEDMKPKVTQQDCAILVDSSLQPNEIRTTYWKIVYNRETGEPIAVDGGIQISPEGVSYVQQGVNNCVINYTSYFSRGFLA
jgi:hypothetical protein